METDRDLLVTLRLKVKNLEDRVGKVEDRLEEKYDIVIDKIEAVDGKFDKHIIAFWKYLATSVISILTTAGVEYIVTHILK